MSDIKDFEAVYADAMRLVSTELLSQERGETKATGYAPIPEILDALQVDRWIREGGMRRDSFNPFLETYLDYSVKLRHPMHVAHQVSVPDYPAALAAMINGLTNNPMAIYEMGPSAAAIEFAVINWMLQKIGWPPQPLRVTGDDATVTHAAGVLTHGGSLANLTALLAARGTIAPEAWRQGVAHDLVVLAPPSSHYSLARAVAILGLGEQSIVHLPANHLGVVDANRVAECIAGVRATGKRCMALVANACATATGLHDPLRALGEICQSEGVWLHVDACHGASALLHPRRAGLLDGIALADSVVWDAHKMLQVPALCAAVLFRDAASFERAFHQDASYLAYGEDVDSYDSLPRAIECTKAALGFKLFMNLAWRGEQALGDYVDQRYTATHRFWQLISDTDGFECPYEPESNILCFRFGENDQQQVAIRDAMVRDGVAHITSAVVDHKRWLRLTVMNPLTDDAAILAILAKIRSYAAV